MQHTKKRDAKKVGSINMVDNNVLKYQQTEQYKAKKKSYHKDLLMSMTFS